MPVAPAKVPTPSELHGLPPLLRLSREAKAREFHNWSTVPNAVAMLKRAPAVEESIHFIMGGQFVAFDVVPALQRIVAKPIARLWMTTLGFSKANVEAICEMVTKGLARNVRLMASHYFKGVEQGVVDSARASLEKVGARLLVTRCHAKIVLMEFGPRLKLVLETSANLRSCNSLEQACLTNSAPLFDFHAGWIGRLRDIRT